MYYMYLKVKTIIRDRHSNELNELKFNISIQLNHLVTKPYYLKQNYAIHHVTYVTFCITILFQRIYYACRFF